MIAAFAVLALLALASGLRGERSPMFTQRMLPKWLTVGLVMGVLALGVSSYIQMTTVFLVFAGVVSVAECALIGLIFYVCGRIAHRAPKESIA